MSSFSPDRPRGRAQVDLGQRCIAYRLVLLGANPGGSPVVARLYRLAP
jgi:hypothetical protein